MQDLLDQNIIMTDADEILAASEHPWYNDLIGQGRGDVDLIPDDWLVNPETVSWNDVEKEFDHMYHFDSSSQSHEIQAAVSRPGMFVVPEQLHSAEWLAKQRQTIHDPFSIINLELQKKDEDMQSSEVEAQQDESVSLEGRESEAHGQSPTQTFEHWQPPISMDAATETQSKTPARTKKVVREKVARKPCTKKTPVKRPGEKLEKNEKKRSKSKDSAVSTDRVLRSTTKPARARWTKDEVKESDGAHENKS